MSKWAPRVVWALVLALGGYELVALTALPDGLTLSEFVWGATDRYPVLAFLGGFLAGHFWWPRRPSP